MYQRRSELTRRIAWERGKIRKIRCGVCNIGSARHDGHAVESVIMKTNLTPPHGVASAIGTWVAKWWRTLMDRLMPFGYQDEAGFHAGAIPKRGAAN